GHDLPARVGPNSAYRSSVACACVVALSAGVGDLDGTYHGPSHSALDLLRRRVVVRVSAIAACTNVAVDSAGNTWSVGCIAQEPQSAGRPGRCGVLLLGCGTSHSRILGKHSERTLPDLCAATVVDSRCVRVETHC